MTKPTIWKACAAALIASPLLAACGGGGGLPDSSLPAPGVVAGTLETKSGARAAINPYLWRASLDTLSFMPLTSAEPVGGVIITDWYTPPQTPDERFKMTIYITDTALRADALQVNIFKQVRFGSEDWVDSSVTEDTRIKVEDAILTRARQLRVDTIEN